jgi:peptidoglycan hydrolase-like protein with peptidoglycan-binding domain
MANEPELHPQTSDEWVSYLKQLLAHWGYWHGDTDENFTDELADAVRSLQQACGVATDGVVRADTWAVLTGETAASQEHAQQQGTTAADRGQDGNSAVHASQVPASFEHDGAPAFEYSIEPVPIAEADVSTPEFDAHVELEVTGTLNVSFPHKLEGFTLSNEGMQLEASQTVQGLAHGIQISGIGSENPAIVDTWGSEYAQFGFSLAADGEMVFRGEVHVAHTEPSGSGEAVVQGTLGYNLKVRIVAHPTAEQSETEPVHDEQSWFEQHRTLTLVGVAVALVAIGVVVTLATAGTATAPVEAAAIGELGALGVAGAL